MRKPIIFMMILSFAFSFALSMQANETKEIKDFVTFSEDQLQKVYTAEQIAAEKQEREKLTARNLRIARQETERKQLALATGEKVADPKAVDLEVDTDTTYYTSNYSGDLVARGEVRNWGLTSAVYVKVTARAYMTYGTYLGTDYTYIQGGTPAKGSVFFYESMGFLDRGFFEFTLEDVPYSLVSYVTYTITYSTYSHTACEATLTSTVSSSSSLGDVKFTGNITNTSSGWLTYFTEIIFGVYNSSGRLIDVDSAFVDGSSYTTRQQGDTAGTLVTTDTAIAPGASAPYTCYTDASYTLASTYRKAYEFWEAESTAATTYNLTVKSSGASSVSITVSKTDNNGDKSGTTTFTRTYNEGTSVTLTAPATSGGKDFSHWIADGTTYTTRAIDVTMDSNITATAYYVTAAVTGYTLTVKSSGASSVPITVDTTDNNGDKNGTTTFTRVYDENTLVTLTAPATSGGKYFSHWNTGGTDFATQTLLVGMISNKTATAYYTSSPPEIAVNRTALYFCYVLGGSTPAPQTFIVSNSGGGTLDWTVTETYDAISVSPTSGSGGTIITVNVNPAPYGYGVGDYSGDLTVSATGATSKTVTVHMKVINANQNMAPIGDFATPADGSLVSSSVAVTGWVVDDTGVASVKIYYKDGNALKYIGDAVFVDGARADITAAYLTYPASYKAGWGYMLLTNFLPKGDATYELHAIATDSEGKQTNLGSKTITVNNATAVKPFGAIDTPGQGGTASGSAFSQVGWVLTPMPNTVPTDGSGISVYVNGVYKGHPQYNIYREDIATYFPGYNNSNGSLAKYVLDTTAYSTGIHSIFWIATDNAGNADGIGSRFFTVENSGGARTASETGQTTSLTPVTSAPTSHARRSGSFIDTIPMDYAAPVTFKNGPDNAHSQLALQGEDGISHILMEENERIVIDLSGLAVPGSRITGYTVTGSGLSRLPLGSTLDSGNATFSWAPVLGYMGTYKLVFIVETENGKMRKDVRVTINAKCDNN